MAMITTIYNADKEQCSLKYQALLQMVNIIAGSTLQNVHKSASYIYIYIYIIIIICYIESNLRYITGQDISAQIT